MAEADRPALRAVESDESPEAATCAFSHAVNAGIHDEPEHPALAAARAGISGASERLPFLDRIQAAFGTSHDLSGVRTRTGGDAAAAASAMGALGFAIGDHIGFAESPDLHTAAHEAAHVIQQRDGVSLKSAVGSDGDAYELHADAVADAVCAGISAASLLASGPRGGTSNVGVQMHPTRPRFNRRHAARNRVEQLVHPNSPIWRQLNPNENAPVNCPATTAALDLFLETGRIEPAPAGTATSTFRMRIGPWSRQVLNAGQMMGLVSRNDSYAVIEGTRPEAFATTNNVTPQHYFILVRHAGQLTIADASGAGSITTGNAAILAYLAQQGFQSFRYYSSRFEVQLEADPLDDHSATPPNADSP